MKKTIEPALSAALAGPDIPSSIELLRNWLVTATAGEPEALVRETRAALRPKAALLMRDLLSGYPATILGAPVLLLAHPDSDSCRRQMASVSLPPPAADTARPCADLRFLGWLPTDTLLPVARPFRPEYHPVSVPWFKPTAAVAVFRSHADVFDYDSIELPNWWWGELFRPTAGNIRLASRVLLPYPDALEAARVLEATANAQAPAEQGLFLSDAAWHWAHSEGVLFHETCRHLYSDDI
ncbi:hypothetical protein PQQ52_28110 [Paraburkholderia sediminicola]|uniref:hypothetical protein n=1 Tax=Paraburkholderia sediminicola TaxID=458836 RepID=UPI0038BD8CB0